jgi:hypothetical protein
MPRMWGKPFIDKHQTTESQGTGTSDIDRLWDYFKHEDNLLATRVSVFLVAQSILIAVAASLANTLTSLSRSSNSALRSEMFGLTAALAITGLSLTLISWYIFTLNFDNIGGTMERLQADPLFVKLMADRSEKRNSHWYFRAAFRKKGINWVVVNGLALSLLFLWCAMLVFLVAVFLSH